MNSRTLIHSLLGLGCAAALWAAARQYEQVSGLQAREQNLRAQIAASHAAKKQPLPEPGTPALTEKETLELVALRGEITQLHRRERELSQVRAENQSLRAKLASGQTNAPGSIPLPPGYIRRKDAQFAGFGTPEATLQSFFWSLANRDTNTVLRALAGAPEELAMVGREEFWQEAGQVPGYRILKSELRSPSEVVLKVEMMPGDDQEMIVRKNGQEWQLNPSGR